MGPDHPGGAHDPFDGLTDEQVLARCVQALKKVEDYPVGSIQRSIQWAAYDQAKAELDLRFYAHVIRKLRADGA
jgi:hypothetical protein